MRVPYVICGSDVASVTAGGAPATLIVPRLVGTSASRYLYVPATSNVKEYVLPGPRMGETKVPVVETT